ncbi:uncharacterized protein Dana_GF23041, isoform B [Drosophila ananassae]|nr:mitochondrial glutamate carrier 1 isoform X2 [Drosophila ananassae]KPU72752.1 uncharacterized protein Dana_GF23041, isoform B [Drosophila ananassae]
MIASEGYFGMYRGSFVNILFVTPEKAIKLTANDYFRHRLASDGVISLPRAGLAGGLAGLVQMLITTPVELVKIRLQESGRVATLARAEGREVPKVTTLGVTKKVIQEHGIFGFYKGMAITAQRDVLFSVIYFPLMSYVNDLGPRKSDGSGEAVFYWSLMSGLFAGMVGAISVTPMDVIKTRLQAGNKEYAGVIDCYRKTLKHEGVTAFFKGGLCRITVLAPMYGIAQTIYFLGVGEKILGLEYKKSV